MITIGYFLEAAVVMAAELVALLGWGQVSQLAIFCCVVACFFFLKHLLLQRFLSKSLLELNNKILSSILNSGIRGILVCEEILRPAAEVCLLLVAQSVVYSFVLPIVFVVLAALAVAWLAPKVCSTGMKMMQVYLRQRFRFDDINYHLLGMIRSYRINRNISKLVRKQLVQSNQSANVELMIGQHFASFKKRLTMIGALVALVTAAGLVAVYWRLPVLRFIDFGPAVHVWAVVNWFKLIFTCLRLPYSSIEMSRLLISVTKVAVLLRQARQRAESSDQMASYLNVIRKKELNYRAPIVFKSVSLTLGYQPVLKRISFKIHQGERVALFGCEGGGRSTIFELMTKIHQRDEGRKSEISMFDTKIEELQEEVIKKELFLIEKHPVLFEGRVIDNIDPYGCFSLEQIKGKLVELEFGFICMRSSNNGFVFPIRQSSAHATSLKIISEHQPDQKHLQEDRKLNSSIEEHRAAVSEERKASLHIKSDYGLTKKQQQNAHQEFSSRFKSHGLKLSSSPEMNTSTKHRQLHEIPLPRRATDKPTERQFEMKLSDIIDSSRSNHTANKRFNEPDGLSTKFWGAIRRSEDSPLPDTANILGGLEEPLRSGLIRVELQKTKFDDEAQPTPAKIRQMFNIAKSSSIRSASLDQNLREVPEKPSKEELSDRSVGRVNSKKSDQQIQIAEPDPEYTEDVLKNLHDFLTSKSSFEGKNLEVDARRFIMFCRAILSSPRILMIHEDCLSFGFGTLHNLKTLARELPQSTIISITSNVDSLLLYDQLIFLDAGMVIEKGDPSLLVTQQDSYLNRFLRETNAAELRRLMSVVHESKSKTSGCITGKDSAMSPLKPRSFKEVEQEAESPQAGASQASLGLYTKAPLLSKKLPLSKRSSQLLLAAEENTDGSHFSPKVFFTNKSKLAKPLAGKRTVSGSKTFNFIDYPSLPKIALKKEDSGREKQQQPQSSGVRIIPVFSSLKNPLARKKPDS